MKRIPAGILACAALCGELALAQHDHAYDSVERALPRLMRESKEGFRGIEGGRVENRRRDLIFESKVYLPDAEYCRIFQREALIYACEWHKDPGKAGLSVLFDRTVVKIEAVLGAEWSKKSGSTKSRKDVLFRAERKPLVQVILESGPAVLYVLVMPPDAPENGVVNKLPSLVEFVHP